MSAGTEWIVQTVETQGMALLFPLAILEGPIVSVIAGWLSKLGYVSLVWAYVLLVVADLVGDTAFYALGRGGLGLFPERWRERLGLTEKRISALSAHFEEEGGRTLIIAKLTHTLGFAALVAAGAGRMPVLRFLWFNLLGTLPKTLVFVLIGYALGQAHDMIGNWIWRASIGGLVLSVVIVGIWYLRRRKRGGL